MAAVEHTCNVCASEYSEADGGIEGIFGITEVNFCPWCYSCVVDMVHYHDQISNDDDETPHTNH